MGALFLLWFVSGWLGAYMALRPIDEAGALAVFVQGAVCGPFALMAWLKRP